MKSFLLKFLLFAIGYLSLQSYFRSTIPYDCYGYVGAEAVLQPKIAQLQKDAAINALFLGSSQVRHHIIPSVFDSVTGLTSLNLGVNGMMFFEGSYLLDKILAEEQVESIKYIFFEVPTQATILQNEKNPFRPNYYYDLKRTIMAMQYNYHIAGTSGSSRIIKSFLARYIGSNILRQLRKVQLYTQSADTSPLPNMGYSPLQLKFKPKTKFVNCTELKTLQEDLVLKKALIMMKDKCNRLGITFLPIYLAERYRCDRSADSNYISLGDFGNYELYEDPDLWFGPGHLNHIGAKYFSQALGGYLKNNHISQKKCIE